MKLIDKFPKGVRLTVEIVFRGEYRIGWVYKGICYQPGSGSYFDFDTAIEKAWDAFNTLFDGNGEKR